MKLKLKQTKKILLTLTFYFHQQLWIHLILLFLANTLMLMGLSGIFESLQLEVFQTSIIHLIGLALFLTVFEHLIKTFVSSQMLQIIMGSFGMGSAIIIIVFTAIYDSIILDFRILSSEGLIGFSFLFIMLRFYMRKIIVVRFLMRKQQPLKGIKK